MYVSLDNRQSRTELVLLTSLFPPVPLYHSTSPTDHSIKVVFKRMSVTLAGEGYKDPFCKLHPVCCWGEHPGISTLHHFNVPALDGHRCNRGWHLLHADSSSSTFINTLCDDVCNSVQLPSMAGINWLSVVSTGIKMISVGVLWLSLVSFTAYLNKVHISSTCPLLNSCGSLVPTSHSTVCTLTTMHLH